MKAEDIYYGNRSTILLSDWYINEENMYRVEGRKVYAKLVLVPITSYIHVRYMCMKFYVNVGIVQAIYPSIKFMNNVFGECKKKNKK